MLSYKLYKISKIITSGNINQLSNIFQEEWLRGNGKRNYNSLDEKEKESLNNYVDERKIEIEEEISSKTKNSQYKSWIYDVLIKKDQMFEDIDKIIKEIKNLEYLKKNKNVLNEKLETKLENKDFDIKTYKTFGELHTFTSEYLELFKKRALKTNNLKTDFEKVFSGEKYDVYKITKDDKDLFQELYGKTGYNTAWCVANKNTVHFDRYFKNNSDCYYLFTLKNNKPYALLHFESGQFKDIHDDKLNDFSDDILDFLGIFVDDFYFAGDLKEYSLDTIKKKNPNITQNEIFVRFDRKSKLNEDGNIDFNGDVSLSSLKTFVENGKLTVKFGKVFGYFECNNLSLTSLEGCPREVTGYFDCSGNLLTSLKGCPLTVNTDFNCSYNLLENLENAPKTVGGSFSCSDNRLENLVGVPTEIGGSLNCSYNLLENLAGAPQKVNWNFNCSYNLLENLENAPREVGGDFYCEKNEVYFTDEQVRQVCNVKGTIYN